MGTGVTPAAALRKAFIAAGFPARLGRTLLLSIADRDKAEAVDLASGAAAAGFALFANPGTAAALTTRGLAVQIVAADEALALVRDGKIGVVVNTPTHGQRQGTSGFALRRAAVELNVPTLTSLDSARAMLEAFAPSVDTDLVSIGT